MYDWRNRRTSSTSAKKPWFASPLPGILRRIIFHLYFKRYTTNAIESLKVMESFETIGTQYTWNLGGNEIMQIGH